MYTASHVSLGFLKLCGECGDLLSNLKLQKMLYYAQGWYLGLHNKALFNDPIEAWVHGPVVPNVYRKYKSFGWGPIILDETERDTKFDVGLLEHLKDVWGAYGRFSAFDLERLSHVEKPWLATRGALEPDQPSKKVISIEIMRSYFRGLANA